MLVAAVQCPASAGPDISSPTWVRLLKAVGDGEARIHGLLKMHAGEIVEAASGVKGVALTLESDNVGLNCYWACVRWGRASAVWPVQRMSTP